MSARPRLRLLHTSDVHLGAYDYNGAPPDWRDRLHDAFRRVIDTALAQRVDAVLIPGDFFDNARVWKETLHFAAAQIARAEVPVVIAPGNHDHVGPGSVYDRLDFAALAPNLHLLRAPEGETVALPTLELELWARSHTELDRDFTPFGGAPPRGEAAWQVAMGHGHYIHPSAALGHSFHIRAADLDALDRDYVALGHWERMVRVSGGQGVAAYSGCPESLGGSLGGRVLIVDLAPDGAVRLTAPSLHEAPALDHDAIPLLIGH